MSDAPGRLGLRLILLLGGLATVSPIATDMYLPAFPTIGRDLGVSAQAVQLTLSAYLLPLALGQLLFGALADAHGRRRFVTAGSAVLLVGSIVCASAPSIAILVSGRILQGIGGAAAMVSGRAMIADLLTGRRAARAYIAVGTAAGLGPIIAPTLGAWLADSAGWRTIFWAIGALQTVLLGLALATSETLPASRRSAHAIRALAPRLLTLARTPSYSWQLVVSTASFVGLFSYIAASPFVAAEMGLSTREFTIDFALNGAGMMAVSLICAALVVRVGRRRVMAMGLLISLGGGAALCLAAAEVAVRPLTLIGFFLVCCAKGSIGGNSYSFAASAAPDSAGLALATMGAVQFVAAALTAAVIGAAAGPAIIPVAVATTGAAFIALAAQFRIARLVAVPG